ERLYSVAVSSVDPNATPIQFPRMTVLPDGEFNFADLQEEAKHTSRMRERRGIAGYVIAEGKTITVDDVETDSRFLVSNTTSDIRSMVVVPVTNGKKRLGTITAVSTLPNTFSKTDEQLLEKLSVQATTAIENARLYEAERVQRELAEAQAESAAILNRTLELNQVLEHILQQTMRAVPCKAVNIKLLGESNLIETHYRRYVNPADQELDQDSPATPLSSEAPLIQAMLKSREPLIVGDTENDPRWIANPKYAWIRSYAGIPLTLGNQIIGFLNVDSDKPHAFSQETVHRLKSFADNAAIAIQNARLYNILEEALKQEKSTRAQLLQADKLTGMGRMVASVAHELNNPLQTIKNCLFLIDQNYANESDAELLNMALSEVERLSDIVARLREVYRPQQQDLIQPIKLKHLMADVQMLLETHLRRSRVRLRQNLPEEDFVVMGIIDQLKQVFLNLSLNAIEAMQPDGGTLNIEFVYDESKREIGVAFHDTGPGIPANNLQKVFDPFFTTKETGMGLGLSICYDIAQNHNGRITVESESDEGAIFTVWLPLIPAENPVNQAI
ncbi:MAG: GAF domain-containing protein, partial [Anaerolineales bacterium]|nr:GAF domain-containing protein [Anaerolineales bacterium]